MSRRLAWLAVLVLVAASYWLIVRPAEDAVAETNARAESFLGRALADEAAVANADRLLRLQHEIAQELAGVSLRIDRPGLVAGLLHDLAGIAGRRGVRLLSVRSVPTLHPPERDDPFEALNLEVAMAGRYRDLLETIGALSRSRVLMRVDGTSIERAGGQGSVAAPGLLVSMQMTVFHLRADASI